MLNKYGKGSVVWTSTVFGHVYHVDCRRDISEMEQSR